MNIVHIIFSFNLGGAELMLIDIINKQIESNIVSLIIVNDYNNNLIDKIDKSVQVHLIKRIPGSRNPFPILRLNFLLQKKKIDILHCHDEGLIKLIFLKRIKCKSSLTIHDTGISSTVLSHYKILFAISNAVKDDIEYRYGLKPILIYNGINSDLIKTKKEGHIKKNKINIVQISRLEHHKKGQDILINSIAVLLKKNDNIDINIDFIGEGSSFQYLKSLTQELQLDKNINFLGLKDREYVYSHIADYDLLIQPSIYEGFGLTIVEAMFAKVPVMVSNIEGPMEIIKNGRFGYYFEVRNVNDLVNELNKFIREEEKNINLDEVYNYAKSNFSIDTTVNNYIKYYKNI